MGQQRENRSVTTCYTELKWFEVLSRYLGNYVNVISASSYSICGFKCTGIIII